MSIKTSKVSMAGTLVLALVSSAALAGGKPIGGGGGGGKNTGGGDTGPTVTAALTADNSQAICNWSGTKLPSGAVAYCEGLDVTVTRACPGEPYPVLRSSSFRMVGDKAVRVNKSGSGSTTLYSALPSIDGDGTSLCKVCTVSFSGVTAGVVGVNTAAVVADTTVIVNNCQ